MCTGPLTVSNTVERTPWSDNTCAHISPDRPPPMIATEASSGIPPWNTVRCFSDLGGGRPFCGGGLGPLPASDLRHTSRVLGRLPLCPGEFLPLSSSLPEVPTEGARVCSDDGRVSPSDSLDIAFAPWVGDVFDRPSVGLPPADILNRGTDVFRFKRRSTTSRSQNWVLKVEACR